MKNRKLLAILLAFCLTIGLGASALAADGDVPTTPTAGTATVTSTDGETFVTVNDHDNLAGGDDINGADIAVWGRVLSGTAKVYSVSIAWGAMQFEYNSSNQVWNPETLSYTTGEGPAGWLPGYVNGVNNKITVTNHSNAAVDAEFSYTMSTTNVFNAATGPDNVVGNFFSNNDDALDAAVELTGTATVVGTLSDNKLSLASAEDVDNPMTATGAARVGEAYFAFSGTPDATQITTFTRMGTINVAIAPVVVP